VRLTQAKVKDRGSYNGVGLKSGWGKVLRMAAMSANLSVAVARRRDGQCFSPLRSAQRLPKANIHSTRHPERSAAESKDQTRLHGRDL
jgi:hypothetical protein